LKFYSKEETDILGKEIQRKCGKELEAHIHSLRKPWFIILNAPDDTTTSSIEDSILRQNPELNLRGRKYNGKVRVRHKEEQKCSSGGER
jgi:hypothetical protein